MDDPNDILKEARSIQYNSGNDNSDDNSSVDEPDSILSQARAINYNASAADDEPSTWDKIKSDIGDDLNKWENGFKESWNEAGRAQENLVNVYSNPDSTYQDMSNAADYDRQGRALLLNSSSVVPAIAGVNFIAQAEDNSNGNPLTFARNMTYGSLADELESGNLKEQLEEHPFNTVAGTVLNALPLVGAAYGGYKLGRRGYDHFKTDDAIGDNSVDDTADNPDTILSDARSNEAEDTPDDSPDEILNDARNEGNQGTEDDSQSDYAQSGSDVVEAINTGHPEVDQLVAQASAKYGVDPALIHKVIMQESGYDPDAVSNCGAQGLMQLMPETAAGLGVNDSFDMAQNIDGGVHYLRECLDATDGDVHQALARYNGGPGYMNSADAQAYADAVLNQSVGGTVGKNADSIHAEDNSEIADEDSGPLDTTDEKKEELANDNNDIFESNDENIQDNQLKPQQVRIADENRDIEDDVTKQVNREIPLVDETDEQHEQISPAEAVELDDYISQLKQQQQNMINDKVQSYPAPPKGVPEDVYYRQAQNLAQQELSQISDYQTLLKNIGQTENYRSQLIQQVHPMQQDISNGVNAEFSKIPEDSYFSAAQNGDYAKAAELARQAGDMGFADAFQRLADTNGGTIPPKPHLNYANTKPYTDKTINMQQILNRAQQLFLPIRTGRIGMKNVEGMVNHDEGVISLRRYGDLGVLSHELGHVVDAALKLRGDAGDFDNEFSSVVHKRFGNAYDVSQVRGEGIAEFMHDYLTNERLAKQEFPRYYGAFQKKLSINPDIQGRIGEIKSMIKTWQNQPAGAKIIGTTAKNEQPTFKERISQGIDNILPKWIDKKIGIRQAENNIEKISNRKIDADDSAYVYSRMAVDRGVGAAKAILEEKDGKTAQRILNKMYGQGTVTHPVTFPDVINKLKILSEKDKPFLAKQGLKNYNDALSSYLTARRFIEVHDLETAKTGKNYAMPLKYESYLSYVKSAPKLLKDAAQDIYNIEDNVRRIMVKTGILSQKQYKYLTAKHSHYVSLQRDFPDDANLVNNISGKGFINITNPLRRLKEQGSTRNIKDPLQNFTKNVYDSLSLAERNTVGQKWVNNASLRGVGGLIRKVTGNSDAKDSTFYVWENGKKETYQTTPEIYQALKTLKDESSDTLLKYLAELPARWMRAGAVTYNPAFTFKNLFRDQLTAYLYSDYGYKPFYDMSKGIYHMIKQDDIWKEYKASGAIMSTLVNADKDFASDMLKNVQAGNFKKVFHYLNPLADMEAFSNIVEHATRVGLYNRARQTGASMTKSAFEARQGTVDFGRSGTSGKAANRYIPFFNAAIQDPVLFFEKFKENPARMAKRLFISLGVPSLAIYAMIRSNPQASKEYDEMMSYEKNNFWNIPVPQAISSTGWIRLPKPFAPGLLFASFPERLLDLTYSTNRNIVSNWATDFLSQLSPSIALIGLQAAAEWMSNYSFFKERNIVPESKKGLAPAAQYGPYTSEIAKEVGKIFNVSPYKVDNLGQNLFAGAYSTIANAVDAAMGKRNLQNPFSAAFTVDPYRSPQSIQDYYDILNEVDGKYKAAKAFRQIDPSVYKNYRNMNLYNKRMEYLNKQAQAAQQTNNQDVLRAIRNEQITTAKQAVQRR
ncbi:LPD38 domain-containing protein [Pectinatus frisingensis]|uniref:LPD38 domain-containing protein n=1 Tax=Pectinatus frisingensis TaxID=865 RepID=UPI0018C74684|nr:LPD38 domain-containing protein [Pectinatus frisingensis]